MYGLVIDGENAPQRRAALEAAIETVRRDLLGELDQPRTRFFNQGRLLLTIGQPRRDLLAQVDQPVDMRVPA